MIYLLTRRRIILLGLICITLTAAFLLRDGRHYPTLEELEEACKEASTPEELEAILGPPHKVLTFESDVSDLAEPCAYYQPKKPGETVYFYVAKHGLTGPVIIYYFKINDTSRWVHGNGFCQTWELNSRTRLEYRLRKALGW